MPTLTIGQVANYAANAGFTGTLRDTMVAIAMAESSGRTDVVNYLGCVGLWQIYQSVWVASHPTWTTQWLKDPANNAKAAYTIYKVQGLSAWSTYTNGAYKKYLTGAAKATTSIKPISKGVNTGGMNEAGGGPKAGYGVSISSKYLDNKPTLDDFTIMGSKLKVNIKNAVTSANVSLSADSVSQITLTVMDPDFKVLKSELFRKGMPCKFQDMNFNISSIETTGVSGTEAVTIKVQPNTVFKLKGRRGTKIMKSSSPSQFVLAECKAVGAKYCIQASAKRTQVARDVPKKGTRYEADQAPSSWTTFQRLADELGYVIFEQNNTIYFGQPTWLLERSKKAPLIVTWNTGYTKTLAEKVPTCSKSVTDKETSVQVVLPLQRNYEAKPGRTLKLIGVPTFDGNYLIKNVEFDLIGEQSRLSVTAGTPINPTPQPPAVSNPYNSSLADTLNLGSEGNWPLPARFKVTTRYGVRGAWAAGFHTGADFSCPTGTPVYAVYSGTIDGISPWGGAYGKHVILKVGGKKYGYCHLSKINVHKGQTVVTGQLLGYSGNTGNTTGPHLHLELRTSPYGYNNKCKDPIPTLMQKNVSGGNQPRNKYDISKANNKLASDFVWWALSRAGGRYQFGAPRDPNDATQTVFDCSSLVQWCAFRCGITMPGDTFSQEPYLKKKGTKIGINTAYRVKGALLYRSTPGREHVAISLGNGKTIEAVSTDIGIRQMSASGRGWTAAYLVPGMKYGTLGGGGSGSVGGGGGSVGVAN